MFLLKGISVVVAIVVFNRYNSDALLRNDDVVRTYRLRSEQYGYVHHYGIYENLDLLNFSLTKPPAHFRVRNRNVLQEVKTGKCVHRLTDGNQQLVLNKTCDGKYLDRWIYSPSDRHLQDITAPGKRCLSPWNYAGRPPKDLNITTVLSECDTWNEIFVEAVFPSQAKEESIYN